MTFSLRPSSVSTGLTAASVSTRVVSWKEAAEMNELVCNDALVMPSSTGAGWRASPLGDELGVLVIELDLVDLLAQERSDSPAS